MRPPVTHVHVRVLDNARTTPGNSTCLSLEPCCLNQGFCRWPLLPGLLLFQLVLCMSAPIREKKKLHINVCALFYLLLGVASRSEVGKRLAQSELLSKRPHQASPVKGCLQVEMDKIQCVCSHFSGCMQFSCLIVDTWPDNC